MIEDKKMLKWIDSLKIPPNYKNVRISNIKTSKILAIGKDDIGRKQYTYNPKYIEEQQEIINNFKQSRNCCCPFTIDELKHKLKDIINLTHINIDNLNYKSIIKLINNNTISNKIFLRTKENEENFKILQNYIETIQPLFIIQTNFDEEQNNIKPLYGWIMQINDTHYLLGLPNKTLKDVKLYVKNYIERLKIYQIFDNKNIN
mgnify:CR=1 FL=1